MRYRFATTLLLCAAAFGADKTPLPKDLPPYGPMKPFTPPRVTEQKLPNGLTLWLAPESGFPKVALTIAVRGGMAADPPGRPGLAEFLQETVGQGTKTRTARQIAEQLQDAGGDLQVTAGPDLIRLSTTVLADRADAALPVLADIVQNATFPTSEVEIARRNLADSLRAREAEPDFLANRALAKAVFGEHPYSIIAPTQTSIAAATAGELRAQYSARFQPGRALLVVVGDFDPEAMASLCTKLFGSWRPGTAATAETSVPRRQAPHAIFTIGRPGSVQTTLVLAAFAPARSDPQYAAAEVADAILGGGFTSRLIQNIREDKGYTYSPGSSLELRRRAVLEQVSADVRNAVTGASFNEMVYELNRMATTDPTAEEVSQAQRFLIGNKAISLQSRESVARQLAGLWANGLPPEELGAESERIGNATPAAVAAVGRRYFPAAQAAVVAVGEPKVLQEQLAPFGVPMKPTSATPPK
jgi:zinc protease